MSKKDKEVTSAAKVGGLDQVADETGGQERSEIQTPAELRAAYPEQVKVIEDEIVTQIGQCSAQEIKENLPDLYDRIVEVLRGQGGPNLNVPGFLLDTDDPFADATLVFYASLKGLAGLRVPYVLPAADKGKGPVNEKVWKKQFAKSETVQAEFKTEKAFYAFKAKIATQVLEYYILLADGGCDPARAAKARAALKKIK
jgi:hypothetical protein